MKKADLKKAIDAGTVIAVAPEFRRGTYPTRAVRATVVAVDQDRRVFSGARWDMSGHIAHDGVRVRYEQPSPGDPGRPPIVGHRGMLRSDVYQVTDDRIVPAASCIAPWDEYEVERARVVDKNAAERTAEEAEEKRHVDAAQRLAELLGDAQVARYYPPGALTSRRAGVQLSIDAAERAIALLLAAE